MRLIDELDPAIVENMRELVELIPDSLKRHFRQDFALATLIGMHPREAVAVTAKAARQDTIQRATEDGLPEATVTRLADTAERAALALGTLDIINAEEKNGAVPLSQ